MQKVKGKPYEWSVLLIHKILDVNSVIRHTVINFESERLADEFIQHIKELQQRKDRSVLRVREVYDCVKMQRCVREIEERYSSW